MENADTINIQQFLLELQQQQIDPHSQQAAEKLDVAKIKKPFYSTKVGVYEHLESLGLNNESALFAKLFDSFSDGLKLK